MNLINIFFLLIIAVIILEGVHRGFLHSALSLGAFFISLITSYLFYPVMSAAIKNNHTMYDYFVYYTEGAEKIASFENTRLLVDRISENQLNEVLSTSNLSEPFLTLIRQNVESKAFAAQGATTLGEYFNLTLVSAVINLISFIIIFLLARVIFSFVLGAVNYTVQLPELRQYNRSMGALFGSIRGFLFCFLIASVIPVIILVLPVQQITEYYKGSDIAVFLSENNFFWHFIRTVV